MIKGVVSLTYNAGLQVNVDGTRHVLAHGGLGEEGVERLVPVGHGRLEVLHVAIRVDGVLQAVQLPAGVADLHAGLTHVDGDALTLEMERVS